MSASETLVAAQAAGVRVEIEGASLLIEADCSPPQTLLDALKRDKLEILTLLSRSVNCVETPTPTNATDLHGLTIEELQDAAGEDWPEVCDDPAVLETLAHAIVTRRQREQSERPPHWTETCECALCGPVFLWVGSPEKVLGCPWCFNRVEERPIPRPVAVTCGTCQHFERIDHPHLGHCAKGEPEAIAGLWDTDRRACARWLPSEQNQGIQIYGQ